MDQKKTGAFLRELRREKQLTQEQLAEKLGVSNRSVSRWETGVNMPDFDLIIELANLYDVSIDEMLDGERRTDMIDKKQEQTLLKVADYKSTEMESFSRRLCGLFGAAIGAFVLYSVLEFMGLAAKPGYAGLASFSMGLVFGTLMVGALYTSGYMARVRTAKMRFLERVRSNGKGQEDIGKSAGQM